MERVLRTIHDSCDRFMEDEGVIDLVSQRYEQKTKDVERWYHTTAWARHGWVSDKMLKSVVYHLKIAGIIDKTQDIPNLVWKRES